MMKKPDPKRHFQLSVVKSGIRIAAGASLMMLSDPWLVIAGMALIVAELVGIAEELV